MKQYGQNILCKSPQRHHHVLRRHIQLHCRIWFKFLKDKNMTYSRIKFVQPHEPCGSKFWQEIREGKHTFTLKRWRKYEKVNWWVLSEDLTVSNSGTQAVRFVSRVSPRCLESVVWKCHRHCAFFVAVTFYGSQGCKSSTVQRNNTVESKLCLGSYNEKYNLSCISRFIFSPLYVFTSAWTSFPESWSQLSLAVSFVINTCSLWQIFHNSYFNK